MSKTSFQPLTISRPSINSFQFVGESGEKHIVIDCKGDSHLFFLVHDARVKLIIDIDGEYATLACSIVVVSSCNIQSDIDFIVNLRASHTKADIYALSLLGDNAKAQVKGGIDIHPTIIQAQGYLSEENLLLGKKVQIKTLPMLDVRSNDVKASHGATISRLDEQKLFYLTAKGLSYKQAERLMITSSIQKAIDHAAIDENEHIIPQIFDFLAGSMM